MGSIEMINVWEVDKVVVRRRSSQPRILQADDYRRTAILVSSCLEGQVTRRVDCRLLREQLRRTYRHQERRSLSNFIDRRAWSHPEAVHQSQDLRS